ncbi:MAG: hypothetical protein N2487_05775 [Verrucomicrobiae bacterium]|nr:hypothetical protein [Verrucomicrobiae bacterium]
MNVALKERHVKTEYKKSLGIKAFSLIEVIGILAIMAIAAAVLIPNIVKKMDIAAANAEAQILKNMSDALKLHIKRTWSIPTYTNMADAIAVQMGWDSGAVLTNDRRIARAFLIDPNLRVANSQLPYRQTVWGSTNRPSSVRIMIVSSLFDDLPVTSGVMTSSNDFNAIWNTPDGQVPSIWSSWRGKNYGDLLKIQRINLEPMFKRVSFNRGPNMNTITFGVGTNYNITGVDKITTTASTFSTYYLESTIVYLYRTNGTLDLRQIIESDTSFYFANNNWGGQPSLGAQITGRDFQNCADFFSTASVYPGAKKSATPQKVIDAMMAYMNAYIAWANEGFPTSKNNPLYNAVQTAEANLDDMVGGLIGTN